MFRFLGVAVLFASLGAFAQAPGKVGVLHVQNAILSTAEGKQALNAIQAKFAVRKTDLDLKQTEIGALQEQLKASGGKLSSDAQRHLAREIEHFLHAGHGTPPGMTVDTQPVVGDRSSGRSLPTHNGA